MAVAYVSSQVASQEAGTTLTITKPTSLAAGDIMVAFVTVLSSTSWSTPSGWTSAGESQATDGPSRQSCFLKIADSSDAAASNFSFTGGTDGDIKYGTLSRVTGNFSAAIASYYSVDVDNNSTPSGGTVTFTGGATPKGSSNLIMFGVQAANASGDTNASFSAQAVTNNNPSWTEISDLGVQDTSSGAYIFHGVAYGTYASNSATGNYTLTTSRTTLKHGGILLTLAETIDVTVSPTVVTSALSVQAPTVTGGANISPTVVTMTASVQTPTVTITDPQWSNKAKNSSSWLNKAKS